MDLYDKKDKSIPQKTVVILLESIIILISWWILFGEGYHAIFSSSDPSVSESQLIRRGLLLILNFMVFLRMLVTILYLMKRRMPWEEALNIPFAFAVYYIGFALLGYSTDLKIDFIDVLAIIIFLTGSTLNTFSELQRDRWKKRPKTKDIFIPKGYLNIRCILISSGISYG